MKNKKPLLLAALALVLIAAVVTTLVRGRGEFRYAGTIEATEVDISARVTSEIGEFPAREGSAVKEGELLVNLTCEDLKIAADSAAKDFERAARLLKAGSMPQEAFDHLQARRDETRLRWSWCAIRSPLSGTVLTTYRERGEYVTPGTKLLTLADLSEVWTMIYVAQPMLARLSLGMQVTGFLPELGDRRFVGTIAKISDEAEFTPKNVQTREERTRLIYGIKISLPNTERVLKPGMTIEIRLPD